MISKAVDLFCGIGGLTKGLSLAGIDVAAGFDMDESCRFAYEKNNNSAFICEDILKTKPEEVMKYYQGAEIKILVGCAPCQPFPGIQADIGRRGSLMKNGSYYIHLAV